MEICGTSITKGGMTCNGPDNSEACATPEDEPYQEFATESSRQQTFLNFPSHCPVSSSALSQAGFFYTGDKDKVKCFSCHATVEGWQEGDSAVEKHKTASPGCRFINDIKFLTNDAHSLLPNVQPRTENSFAIPSLHSSHDPSSELHTDYLLRTGQVVDLSSSLYPANSAMCSEEARLRTFHNWPPYALITPQELANAGLYYTGVADEVECFCCGGKLKNWEPLDRAWSEHRRHFPRCFFVLGHDVGNVPNQPDNVNLDRNNTYNSSHPKNPSMADYESRIKTFVTWKYLVNKEQLARSGFYSLGDDDRVACFYCGGGLQQWKAAEDPWEQHAKWFPGCKYLIDEKGHDFVNSVHLTHSLQDSTIEENEKDPNFKDEDLSQNQLVENAMHMGFHLDEIRKAMERKYHISSENYGSVEALVTDLINAQRENEHNASWERPMQRELSMEEKLRSLQEEKLCKICMDRTISVVLIPCGHLVACQDCAEAVDKCPLCCKVIEKRQKIYMY
uniref:E3 ubiquitin-protein ligase XIAP n=1 Tax=Salvator merianae TaxID=96440 RepID=A0A8D0CC13_SALMN